MFWFKRKKKVEEKVKITYKEEEKGYLTVYRNGEKSNLRLMVFSEDQIDRLHGMTNDEILLKKRKKKLKKIMNVNKKK